MARPWVEGCVCLPSHLDRGRGSHIPAIGAPVSCGSLASVNASSIPQRMSGTHPIASVAASLHYVAGTIPLIVFVGASASVLALLLFLAASVSSRFAASKLANGVVIGAWVGANLLCLLAAFGIIVLWLDWATALGCIPGNPEYPCPSLVEVIVETLRTVALLGLPTVIVWLTTRRLKSWR